jgi:hypothetical protein
MTAITLPAVVRTSTPAIFGTVKAVYRFVDSVFAGAAYEPTRAVTIPLDRIRIPR